MCDSSTGKREKYLEWPDYFMAMAFLAAKRSKDPSTQVGCCIVNEDKKIVALGYNGFPIGCSDDVCKCSFVSYFHFIHPSKMQVFPWGKEANDPLESKYTYVCHAEVNAVLNKNASDLKNCTLYVALFPCNECAKVIIQSRIREIIYLSDKHAHKPEVVASKKMLDAADVKYTQYVPTCQKIVIDFTEIDRPQNFNQLPPTPIKKPSGKKVDCVQSKQN